MAKTHKRGLKRRQLKNTRKRGLKGGARFIADPCYTEKQDKLLCGKHAFNNIVGGELMKLTDIFEVLKITDPRKKRAYKGNLLNEDLQTIINNIHKGADYDDYPHYSAFVIDSIKSYDEANSRKNRPSGDRRTIYDDEMGNAGRIARLPFFGDNRRIMTDTIKTYMKTLYENFLMLFKYVPNFSGLILQVNNISNIGTNDFSDDGGHYVAIKKLPEGTLQLIDSIGPKRYTPIPFMTDDMDEFRNNCAELISMIFEYAGITYDMDEDLTPVQIIVVKPYEVIPEGNGYNMKNVLNTRFGVGTVRR